MPGWVIIIVLVFGVIIVASWALSHILWIAAGSVLGWFIKEGVDWFRLNVR